MFAMFMEIVTFAVGLLAGLGVWFWMKLRSDIEVEDLKAQLERLEEEQKADEEKLHVAEAVEPRMRRTFQKLASDALNSAVNQLSAQVQKDAHAVVDPLMDRLHSLDETVAALDSARTAAYEKIQELLTQIVSTETRLQATTTSLARSLE